MFHGPDSAGGGAWCKPDALISNCMIVDCFASDEGGGVFGGQILSSRVCENTSWDDGGGVSRATVRNSLIADNWTYSHGGGVYWAEVFGSVIKGNVATDDAGGAWYSILRNCLVTQNHSDEGGDGTYGGTNVNCTIVFNGGTDGNGVSGGCLENCIVYYNGRANVSVSSLCSSHVCTTPDPGGVGNITNDPQFVDAASGDFRLLPASPCINAGTNSYWMLGATDLDGNRRILGGVVDIGAYEFALPRADIKANGSDGPVGVRVGETFEVTISLDPGGYAGRKADWWVIVKAPSPLGWYHFDPEKGARLWLPGLEVSHQGPLVNVQDYRVLHGFVLTPGRHVFHFGVERPMNGSFDTGPHTFRDNVRVTVTP
jgi:hypothetical protein